jgi:hypothetical protein
MLPLYDIFNNIQTVVPNFFASFLHYSVASFFTELRISFWGFKKIYQRDFLKNFLKQLSEYQNNLLKKKFFIRLFFCKKPQYGVLANFKNFKYFYYLKFLKSLKGTTN